MPIVRPRSRAVCGLSFSIADLILLKSWAEAQGHRMTVHLDHGIDGEEYEEVVGLSKSKRGLGCWILWRDLNSVFLQPLIGKVQRYTSVVEAIEALSPVRRVSLTEIQARNWPAG